MKATNFLLWVLLLGAGLAEAAWAQDAERLRIHGSNVLGARLVPELVVSWLKSIGYVDIRQGAPRADLTTIQAVRDGQPVIVEIDKRGTASGLADLIRGDAEICMAARQPTAAERDAAWQLGDLRASGQEWVVALDGLAVVVAADNPLDKLSLAQLQAILGGSIGDWAQIGGRPGPLTLHGWSDNAGTAERVSTLLGIRPKIKPVGHAYYAQVLAAIGSDPGGIGLIAAKRLPKDLKVVAIDMGSRAISADAVALRSEDYPLVQRLYFYTGQLVTALGRGFLIYATSPAGQAVVERGEFAALALQPAAAAVPESAPPDYRQLVAGAQRLPTTLHFASGLDPLDSRARDDIERIGALMRQPENLKRKLLVIGFANPDRRSPSDALWRSQERADYLTRQLRDADLRVIAARGLGGEMALVGADHADARYRNERVELWLR